MKLSSNRGAGPGPGDAADQFLHLPAPGAKRLLRMPLQRPVGCSQPLVQGIEPPRWLLRGQAPGNPPQLQSLLFQSSLHIPRQGHVR